MTARPSIRGAAAHASSAAAVVLMLSISACGGSQPDVDDVPLAEGLRVLAPASACTSGSSYCTLRIVVGGPTGVSRAELEKWELRAVRNDGWRITSRRAGVATAIRGEMSLEVHRTAPWALDASDPTRPVIGVVLERQREG